MRAVLAEAVQRGRTTVGRLADELAAGCQRGTALPRRVLREIELGIRSAGEGWALDVHRSSGLPPVLWNPHLYLPDGRFLASPDAYFREVGLAWEIDSREFHFSPEDWEETLRRRADMQTAQIVVAHSPPALLWRNPVRAVGDLRGAHRLAASRPCPEIVVR